jgi:competence protein ComEC
MNYFTKSKIFLYFCLSFVLGIFIASFLKIPIPALFAAAIFAVVAISAFWRKKEIVIAGFCLFFLILGIFRFQSVSVGKNFIVQHGDSKDKIILQGIVAEEPDVRIKDTRYILMVQSSNELGSSASQSKPSFQVKPEKLNLGKILVTLPHYPAYRYGDLIELKGKLKEPAEFDSFNYKEYLAKDDIYFVMYSPETRFLSSGNGNYVYSLVFSFKNEFKDRLKKLIPEPEISLLNGLLLGERSGMGDNLKNSFAITGTSHIVAVSGFNVTIIAIIILELSLLIGFSRGQSFWLSLLAIILFIIMVGAPASAIRAGIMGGLVIIAIRAGRLNQISAAIVLAAALMIAVNPKILRFDVGFQLSFLAVIGIVWLYPPFDYYLKKFPDILKIKSMLLVTISAQIMALPVLIYNFDRLSLVAPLANILILPFIPIAMAVGFLAGLFGFVWILPAKIVGYFAWFILTYQIRSIEYLASFSWASVEIFNFSAAMFIGYYIIIAAVIIRFKNKTMAQERA